MTNFRVYCEQWRDWKIGDYFLYYDHENDTNHIFKIDGTYEYDGHTYYESTDCISGNKADWFWKFVYFNAEMITEEEAMRYILEA